VASNRERLPLTDRCWCGCQRETTRGAFWFQGHDKIAEAALNAIDHKDSVAQRLHDRGYGPELGHSVIADAVARGGWVTCEHCGYPGRPESVRVHQSRYPNCRDDLNRWPTG
jgi:hypothetical protein